MVAVDLATIFPPDALFSYLGALSILGLAAMGADKASAVIGLHRISERALFAIAFAGGFTGIIAGGVMVRHKVPKPDFWVTVAFATFIWVMLLVPYYFPALL
jgi:uncharacterized membrane protein YsdA (DUF1294 family)